MRFEVAMSISTFLRRRMRWRIVWLLAMYAGDLAGIFVFLRG